MKTRITIAIIALLLAISPVMPAFAAETAPDLGKFAGETVTSVYSLDYAARTYQLVTDASESKMIVKSILGVSVQTSGKVTDKNAVGFLIFTEKGKYPIYLPSSTEGLEKKKAELVELSKSCNKKYTRHMQWFVFMSPENIERITFSAAGGGSVYYTKDINRFPNLCSVSLNTTDSETIYKIAAFLKTVPAGTLFNKSDVPEGDDAVYWTPSTSPELVKMTIRFKNGVSYTCFTNENFRGESGFNAYDKNYFTIDTTDLKEQVTYLLDTRAITDFIMTVPGTVIKLV